MIEVSRPSNIALIKYMGKVDSKDNRPANASISFTLDHLVTRVKMESIDGSSDQIASLQQEGFGLQLSEKGKQRFLNFFEKLKKEFGLTGYYKIQSGNNFPSDCGLASSASSFAALTQAAYQMGLKQNSTPKLDAHQLSKISQSGSGSSCRSFFSPFAIWKDQGANPIDLGISNLKHSILILEDQKKLVSSSEAHKRVTTSLLFQGRVERAEQRLTTLISSFKSGDWKTSYEICWQEFWDMHALFETSTPPFGYMTGSCIDILTELREKWTQKNDGPLVTMDAGPNIHLLFREDQSQQQVEWIGELQSRFPTLKVISSE